MDPRALWARVAEVLRQEGLYDAVLARRGSLQQVSALAAAGLVSSSTINACDDVDEAMAWRIRLTPRGARLRAGLIAHARGDRSGRVRGDRERRR